MHVDKECMVRRGFVWKGGVLGRYVMCDADDLVLGLSWVGKGSAVWEVGWEWRFLIKVRGHAWLAGGLGDGKVHEVLSEDGGRYVCSRELDGMGWDGMQME